MMYNCISNVMLSEVENGIEMMNEELRNVVRFGTDVGIELNPTKSKAIILSSKNKVNVIKYDKIPNISIDGINIEWVSEVRNLGYQLNRTISSDAHVKSINRKVFAAINSIRPLKNILPTEIKLQLIKTLVLPIVDYMDIIYHNCNVYAYKVILNLSI